MANPILLNFIARLDFGTLVVCFGFAWWVVLKINRSILASEKLRGLTVVNIIEDQNHSRNFSSLPQLRSNPGPKNQINEQYLKCQVRLMTCMGRPTGGGGGFVLMDNTN